MSVWAIVPVKPFRAGKSRLACVLSIDEREALNRHLLRNTLKHLDDSKGVEKVLVISQDASALDLAKSMGAVPLQETSPSDLNQALNQATGHVRANSSHGVLILPADLPLLASEDIDIILRYTIKPPVIVVVPDRHRQGTNALLINPAGLIEYQFGPESFRRHCESSRKAGIEPVICDFPSIALDIDFPEDLDLVKEGISQLLSRG